MKISYMILRYCMTYHHYNVYFIMSLIFFCFIMKIAPPLHPTWPGLGGVCTPPHPPSKSIPDKMTPLVAVIPCQKTTETYETLYAVENIHYIPVQTKVFQNIKVHLRSSTEESIPFEHGRAAITLHLKPLNYFD